MWFKGKPEDLYRLLALDALIAAAILMLCGGCATPVDIACPSLPVYSPELQVQAADELDALPDGSVLANIFMPDYGQMRAGVRECIKARKQ